jgi:hypothetical protein
MSDGLGRYAFLPWLRQGISTAVNEVDGTPVPGRSDVKITVEIGGGPESSPIDVTMRLFGPGDVKAFDVRAVARHWPRPDVFEVEPNYFPLLELFPADVAWRYTPVKANAQDRLRPWLGLLVLRDEEIEAIDGPTASRPHAKLTVKSGAPLPFADQLFAWAHVHVDGADNVDPAALTAILDGQSHRAVARLLCPRRLDATTAYTAFLVPTLEAARLAALGLDVDPLLDSTAPAWRNDGSSVELPVFYRWRFQTSDTGDFASLVQRIVARPLPPTVGTQPMDESSPGMGLPAAASHALAAESVLRALDSESTGWDAAERQAWTSAIAALLNLPKERLEQPGARRTLAPPLYGQWYAAANALDPASPPPWFQDLNADPRLRVASSLGWQIVQNDQQQLLAGAWAQVEAVREANAELRHAQLAREVALRMYERHVVVRPAPSVATFTHSVHARVRVASSGAATTQTVRALVVQSPLRVGILQPAFGRLARPLGPVAVRQGLAFAPKPATTLLERVDRGTLIAAPPPPTPTTIVTPSKAAVEIAPPWLTPQLADWLVKVPRDKWSVIEVLLELVLAVWPQFVDPKRRSELLAFLTQIQQALRTGGSPGDDIRRRIAARDGTLASDDILSAPGRAGFVARELRPDGTIEPLPASTAAEDTRFRTAAAAAFADVTASAAAGDVLRPIDIDATAKILLGAIDPRSTIGATFGDRLVISGVPWNPSDPLDPVMAAPSFPQPLYKPLFDISADWILTGLEQLPADSVTLARTNERIIESVMVGANDEMGRTLLFNEYPTDQRGTYFRQFWDVNGVPNPQPDVKPIAQWAKTAALGDNSSRPNPNYLVLVLRAEVLRRYPNMVLYAVQAEWVADGTRRVPTENPVELPPDFLGTLGVGAGFWGFRLDVDEARGAKSPSEGPPGWYFALQEHPSEPRFGLEPATSAFATAAGSWPTLRWSDLAADAASLAGVSYIDLSAALPTVSSIVDPKHAAWHVTDGTRSSDLAYITYREPARLLVHASRMIPPDV